MSEQKQIDKIGDKLKKSTTFGIVIFTAIFLLYNSILQQFLGKEITYMADLVEKGFYIFMLYIGGNKLVNTVGNLKGKK